MNLLRMWPVMALVLLLGCMNDEETDQQKQMKEDDELVQQYIQENQIAAERDATGFYYTPLSTNPGGKAISPKDIVAFKYKISLLNGQVVEDKSGASDSLRKGMHNAPAGLSGFGRAIFPAALDWGLAYMKEGEKFLFLIPSYLAYGEGSLAGKFPANSNFAFEIEVVDILSLEEQKAVEQDSIEAYIEAHALTGVQNLASGLHYRKKEEGTGDKPKAGQLVKAHYTGKLLDGTVFDKSEADKPLTFIVGQDQVIEGWDEGITLMQEGEKATLIIPSHLAYSQSVLVLPEAVSAIDIPPFSTLIFDVELVDVQ